MFGLFYIMVSVILYKLTFTNVIQFDIIEAKKNGEV